MPDFILELLPTFLSGFLGGWFGDLIWRIAMIAITLGVLMGLMAYVTLYERRVLGAIQSRWGPNVVGPWGLLQPLADGAKLFLKETIIPSGANKPIFILAPYMTFMLAIMAWAVVPFKENWVHADINLGMLYILAISSMGVYGILLAGWAGNSKYSFLGGLRSASQMISYELAMGAIIVCVVLIVGSFNLQKIVLWQKENFWLMIPLFPLFIMYFICTLAETNRLPFDLPEAEAELVAGYNVEYSAMVFALFFLGEYMNMMLMCGITVILFMGGWLPIIDIAPFNWIPGPLWFALKIAFLLFFYIQLRTTLPRYRYDQLMRLGWKVFLPISFVAVVLVAGILVATGWLPSVN
ncbi:MAG: NADH-quinone oxidoreductase subunit NuoH [Alphaproteobacteria bacterium]